MCSNAEEFLADLSAISNSSSVSQVEQIIALISSNSELLLNNSQQDEFYALIENIGERLSPLNTLAHHAIINNDSKAYNWLVKNCRNIVAEFSANQDSDYYIALTMASKAQLDLLQSLDLYPTLLTVKSEISYNIIHEFFSASKNTQQIKVFISWLLDVLGTDKVGELLQEGNISRENPLVNLIKNKHIAVVEVLEWLLQKLPLVEQAITHSKVNLAFYAAAYNLEVLQWLHSKYPKLLKKADVHGRTALLMAMHHNELESIRYLLAHNMPTRYRYRNEEGRHKVITALDHLPALVKNANQIAEMFLQAGAELPRNHHELPMIKDAILLVKLAELGLEGAVDHFPLATLQAIIKQQHSSQIKAIINTLTARCKYTLYAKYKGRTLLQLAIARNDILLLKAFLEQDFALFPTSLSAINALIEMAPSQEIRAVVLLAAIKRLQPIVDTTIELPIHDATSKEQAEKLFILQQTMDKFIKQLMLMNPEQVLVPEDILALAHIMTSTINYGHQPVAAYDLVANLLPKELELALKQQAYLFLGRLLASGVVRFYQTEHVHGLDQEERFILKLTPTIEIATGDISDSKGWQYSKKLQAEYLLLAASKDAGDAILLLSALEPFARDLELLKKQEIKGTTIEALVNWGGLDAIQAFFSSQKDNKLFKEATNFLPAYNSVESHAKHYELPKYNS